MEFPFISLRTLQIHLNKNKEETDPYPAERRQMLELRAESRFFTVKAEGLSELWQKGRHESYTAWIPLLSSEALRT